jgi:hypothetical protein
MRNYTLLFSFLLLFVVSDLDAQRSRRSSGRIDKTELNKSDKKGSKELYKAYGFESREEMKDFLLDQDLNRKDRRIVEKYGKGKGLSKGQNRRLEELLEEHRGKRASSETVTRSGRVSGDRALSSRGSSTSRAKSRGRSGRVSEDRALTGRGSSTSRAKSRGRSGRVSEDRALTGRGSSTSRAKSRGRSGRQESQNEGPSFDEIDTNNDGEISRDEARVFFGDEDDFDAKYDEVDADNSGSVDPQEYADANEGDQDGDHDWYCQICDMHFDSGEAMDDHADQMGHTDADFDCDPNHDYPQMDPGPDGGCSDYADCNGNGLFDIGEPCYEGHHQGGPPFEEVDANGDGEISRDEARAFFGDEDDFDAQFDNIDTDNSGSVEPQEYNDASDGDHDGEHHGEHNGGHDWYCQICDMHFDSQEAMDDHANQMGHTNADFDCDPNGDYPQMDPGPDGGCSDYADCNGNGLFDVGEPCYEGDDQGPSFDEVDSNNDGEISYSEAQAVFGQEPDFDERFNDVDSDNSGSVDMAEWEAAGPGDDGDNDQNDGQ